MPSRDPYLTRVNRALKDLGCAVAIEVAPSGKRLRLRSTLPLPDGSWKQERISTPIFYPAGLEQARKLAEELIVLLPESLNLLLLNEDQRSDAGWCGQPIRFWNPGRRAAHHRRSLPEIRPGIKLSSRVQQGCSSR